MYFKEFLSQPVRCLRPTSLLGLRGTRISSGDTSSTAVRMWPFVRWLFFVVIVVIVSIIWCHPPPGQMVRVGLCISTGSCHGLGHAPLTSHVTHVSQCRQLYLDQRLVAVTQTGEVKVGQVKIWMEDLSKFLFKVEMFSFPSCCSCHIMNLIH